MTLLNPGVFRTTQFRPITTMSDSMQRVECQAVNAVNFPSAFEPNGLYSMLAKSRRVDIRPIFSWPASCLESNVSARTPLLLKRLCLLQSSARYIIFNDGISFV